MRGEEKTESSFSDYRARWNSDQPMHSDALRYAGDVDQMARSDGLDSWVDGVAQVGAAIGAPPILEVKPAQKRLWVVTTKAVLHALEKCEFGASRGAGEAKHSNLTGGGRAHCGGELVILNESTIVVNACSGRYRVRGKSEFDDVVAAFKNSGYHVWSMGYDAETNRPVEFGLKEPEQV